MNPQRPLVQAEKVQAGQRPQARQRHIALAVFEGARQVDHGGVERHALALMHGHGPSEPERHLGDARSLTAILLDLPLRRLGQNALAAARAHDGIAVLGIEIVDHAERAVDVAAGGIVLGEHHHRALLQLEAFRRQAAALQRAHERLRPLGDHGEDVRLAGELRQLLLVDVVHGGVVGEEARASRGELVAADQPRGEALAMRADASVGADGGEHVEKRGVTLPVLLRQIADGRGKVRQAGEAWANSAPNASVPPES